VAQRDEPFKRRRPDGTYDDHYSIRWRNPVTGKRESASGFKTKQLARDHRDQQLGYAASQVTLREMRDRFLAVHPGAESTKRELRRRLGKAIETWGEAMNPARLTGEEVEAFRQSLSDGQRHEVTQSVKQAFRWAHTRGLIAVNPAAHVKNPTRRSKPIQPFESWAEIDDLLAEFTSELHRAMIEVAVGIGARPQEWSILRRRGDVDLKSDVPTITIARRMTKDGKIIPATKNGKPRRVPLRPRVVEALKSIPVRIDTPFLFPGEKAKVINLKAFERDHWKPALAGAGLEHRGIYSLRHTYATWLIAEGINTFQLSRVMGTSIEMIDKHYGHLLPDADQALLAAYARFDGRHMDADVDEETG
jgi:integrase